MSAEENFAQSKSQLETLGVSVNEALLQKVINGMGIANQNLDSSLVAASDQSELDTVRKNFMWDKLGIHDDEANAAAVAGVAEKMSQFQQKQRGAFYYLLTVDAGKESVYGL